MELGKPLRSLCLTLGALACLLASNATAQDLTLRVVGQNPRFRSQAPIPLELVLSWNTDKLIEGTLFVEVQDSLTVLMRYENPDVALGFGEFVLPLVLPPLSNEAESIEIKARFQSPVWGNFDLDTTTLKIPADWRRQLLIGMITPAGDEAVRNVFAYLDRISLDQYRPGTSGNSKSGSSGDVDVVEVRLPTTDAPRRAAALCAYDVIVVAADALQELKDLQRDALLSWVDAGGSVLIDGSGSVTDRDCDFLNEICSREAGENAYLVGPNDRLTSPQPILLSRRGIGRVGVTTKNPANFSDSEALDVTCWLWKVRRQTADRLRANGSWAEVQLERRSSPTTDISNLASQGYDPNDLQNVGTVIPPYAPKPLQSAGTFKTSLVPDSVETVPLPIIMTVLGLFLFTIAPGDWLLLGRLRKRMLTWVLFPASCIFFTGVMVFLANRYIGTEDYRTALRFVDWAEDNRVVRITDVETLFTSTATPVEVELDNQLFASVDTSGNVRWQVIASNELKNASYFKEIVPESETPPVPTITGRPTTLYNVSLPIKKWSPTVSRRTSFDIAAEEAPSVDWGDMKSSEVFNEPAVAIRKLATANPGAAVRVISGKKTLSGPEGLDRRTFDFAETATQASIVESRGFFSVVSSISPNGHGSLEDVGILDRTNPDEALVIVVLGTTGDVHAHRRLFHREPTGTQSDKEMP